MIRNLNAPMLLTYWTGELIEPGQWVKGMVQTAGGVWHHGIIRRVVRTTVGSYVEVIHNVKNGGVIVSSLADFAEGVVHLVSRPSSTEHAAFILATADANIGKPYFLFSQNCEHFGSFCYTGQSKSESVQGFMKFAAFVGLAALAFGGDSN